MSNRSSGLLLHVTSLPSPYGIGDLGPEAYRFVDYLAEAGQHIWQVLPLVPVGLGDSPYSSPSTFAGNPLLLSPELMAEDGLLSENDLAGAPDLPGGHVAFDRVRPFKEALLRQAFERFEASADYEAFCEAQAAWLDDYALFMALKAHHGGGAWSDWPKPLAQRDPEALAEARRQHADAVELYRFGQFVFDRQWDALHDYARDLGVQILGDLPIYVAYDSADVWAHPDLFDLDEEGRPVTVAGVPPDYFSETGQRWGNPIYRWDRMQQRGFRWWQERLARTLELVDIVRLDHFRGFEAYWSIPAEEETAVNGEWVEGPGAELFEALEEAIGSPLPLVAEDLGTITPEVRALMEQFGLPGMAVLEFAFGGDAENEYLPHHYKRGLVAYTGTHDNETFVGWYAEGATPDERRYAHRYLALDASDEPAHWVAIRALMASVADTVVVPLQDVLGLGSEARMNTPGVETGNWSWRFTDGLLSPETAERLRHLVTTYGRDGGAHDPVTGP